jgi:hypothetical protein
MRWYEKTFPTIKDTIPLLKEAAEEILRIKGVKDVLTWGHLVENLNKPKISVKDINLLTVCSFCSEDLLSIDQTESGPFGLKEEEMKIQGFNPKSVLFTRSYLKYANFNIDQWAISSDKKLLHWGPIPETIEEWINIRKESEKYASQKTGILKKQLCKSSSKEAARWKSLYDESIQNSLYENINGWYASETSCEEILNKSKKVLDL